jgi:hypothetical protein
MQSPLLDDFGYRQNTDAHEQVLNGVYNVPEECDRATELLIRGLARPTGNHCKAPYAPTTHITTEDHIQGWKRQKERTSGGISGLHFGHYKAHAQERDLAAFDASL